MLRISLLALLITTAISSSVYAQVTETTTKPATTQGHPDKTKQAIHQDNKNINKDRQSVKEDSEEIRAMDRKRNEALRSGNAKLAEKLQADIDQKRAARKTAETDLKKNESDEVREKRLAAEQCAKNPECAKKKKHEELTQQLQAYQKLLANDEAAAARVSQDKAKIASIQAALK